MDILFPYENKQFHTGETDERNSGRGRAYLRRMRKKHNKKLTERKLRSFSKEYWRM